MALGKILHFYVLFEINYQETLHASSNSPQGPLFVMPPYGISIFQVDFFTILKADSDSSKKSSYTNYLSFLKIIMGTQSKIRKTS